MSKEEKLYTQGDIEELNKTIIDNNCEIILKDQRIAEFEDIMKKYNIKDIFDLDVKLDKVMLKWFKEVDNDYYIMAKERIEELEKQLAEIKSSVSDLIGFYEMNITLVERAQIEYIKRQLEKYGIVKSEKPFARCLYLFD